MTAGAPTRQSHKRKPIRSETAGKVLAILKRQAKSWNAPVMALMSAEERNPFLTLIGCILSLRTRDETTAEASKRLFAAARTADAMLKLAPKRLERLIYPVGFYRTKTRVIREICRELIARYGGRVPDEIDELLTLNGVGRKTANLVVTQAYRKPGICVDTHVHRISNRWGLVKTRTPEQTEQALRKVLPRRYWIELNELLVGFGQTICQPVSPRCSLCPIEPHCPRLGVRIFR